MEDKITVFPICICGHAKELHEYINQPRCNMIIHKRKQLLGVRCKCQEFKMDNLRLLEMMAIQRDYR